MKPTHRYMFAVMAVRPVRPVHGEIEPKLSGPGPQGDPADTGRGVLTERQKRRLEAVRHRQGEVGL